MSNPSLPLVPTPPGTDATVHWADAKRSASFQQWLAPLVLSHQLDPDSLRLASADASFRRYLRIDRMVPGNEADSLIIMDAPPDQENSEPFVRIAALMAEAGLRVPQVLDWQREQGFLLLGDLGPETLMNTLVGLDAPDFADPAATRMAQDLLVQATQTLVRWQQASRPDVLPPYDQALLQRELQLFPDWYLGRHRAAVLTEAQSAMLQQQFHLIVQRNLAGPKVYVHRDYMPRNLMTPIPGQQALGVLDFQDAVYGPVTYDIASLMRDAFLSWSEEMVLDITIRYWQLARKAGLLDFEDWHSDFGAFYRGVEWMGLQRHLKVAGIFARLTLRDGKAKYLADAPRFIGYIRATASRYRELSPLLRLLDEVEGTEVATGYAFGRV